MKTITTSIKNIYYPPGGILMWIIIYLELITFCMAMLAMTYYNYEEPKVFHESRLLLNANYGVMNTVFLLTSGFFMAISVNEVKAHNRQKAKQYILLTMCFGTLFLILKSIEYYLKIDAGLNIGYNTFFSFYWMLTLFHVTHVIIGLVILASVYFNLKNSKELILEDIEASAAFWHMCDLIWLLLFPIIYLLF
jgi:nitric oxide reductase NorE protein